MTRSGPSRRQRNIKRTFDLFVTRGQETYLIRTERAKECIQPMVPNDTNLNAPHSSRSRSIELRWRPQLDRGDALVFRCRVCSPCRTGQSHADETSHSDRYQSCHPVRSCHATRPYTQPTTVNRRWTEKMSVSPCLLLSVCVCDGAGIAAAASTLTLLKNPDSASWHVL